MELFFDVETSGFISKKIDFDHKDQAWAIQLAAILSTKDEIIQELNLLIKPAGRAMNYHAEKIHGISLDKAEAEGRDEKEVIARFADLQLQRPTRICHNYSFDSEFISQMFQRNMDTLTNQQRSIFFIDLPHFCTMKDDSIKRYVNAKNVKGKLKWAKLSEMYEKLFACDFPNAHDALEDTRALRDCYYELQRKEII